MRGKIRLFLCQDALVGTTARTLDLWRFHLSDKITVEKASPRIGSEVAREHVACNLCGSETRHPFCPENGLSLVRCDNCGLVYVSPRPSAEELYALYGETYFRNDESGVVGYTDYLADEV